MSSDYSEQHTNDSLTQRLKLGTDSVYVTLIPREGPPQTIDITMGRVGSTERGLLTALSQSVSAELQAGVPIQDIARRWRSMAFEPSGPGRFNGTKMLAASVLDLIAAYLEHRFRRLP